MENSAFLQYTKKYIKLTTEEEAILLSNIVVRTYLKDQYIVQQGDICNSSNFIISGCTKTVQVTLSQMAIEITPQKFHKKYKKQRA